MTHDHSQSSGKTLDYYERYQREVLWKEIQQAAARAANLLISKANTQTMPSGMCSLCGTTRGILFMGSDGAVRCYKCS